MKKLTTLLLFACLSLPLHAAWELDNSQSWLYFVSVKAEHFGELNTFKNLSGTVNAEGKVELKIDLTSVDTNISIRDERMQKYLFKTAEYSYASLTAQLDMETVNNIKVGDTAPIPVEVTLDLHGEQQILTTSLLISRLTGSKILVVSQMPILINAAQFKLVEGVEKLRELAGLPGISKVVPVTLALTFTTQPAP